VIVFFAVAYIVLAAVARIKRNKHHAAAVLSADASPRET
jgi:hypothetical protein